MSPCAGLDGGLGVTALAVSNVPRKYLAVCERAKQAVCIIYDLTQQKKPRYLTSNEYTATEFVDVKFAYSEEKLSNFVLTMTGKPDYRVIIWLWDKQKFIQ